MKRRDTYSRLADRLPPRKASGGNSIININTGPGASGGYLPLDGTGIMTGNIDVGGNNIANVNLVDGIDISAHAANADAHHAQQHGILSSDHTVTGNALDIIGLTATDTLGKLTPSSAPGAVSAILKSSSAGNLTLPTFTATTSVGVGVTTTEALLHAQTTNVATTNFLILEGDRNSVDTEIGILFKDRNAILDGQNVGRIYADRIGSTGNFDLVFHAGNQTAAGLSSEVLRLDGTNARVGVKQASPAYDLDVAGTIRATTSVLTPLITSATNVDLIINPGGTGAVQFPNDQTIRTSTFDSSFPITGFQISETAITNQSQITIGVALMDELRARVFVADETRVDRGNEYWTKSYGILAEGFTTPGTIGGTVSITFEDSPALTGALFSNNDWLLFQSLEIDTGIALYSIWGQVATYVDNLDGTQSWTFTLRSGPTSETIRTGQAGIDFGASGAALIHLSTVDPNGAPYIKMRKWSGANPYTPGNYTTYVQIGELGSVSNPDYTPSGYGMYIRSTNATNRFIVADDNGLRLQNTDIALYNSGTQTVNIDYTGTDIWVGNGSTDKILSWDGSELSLLANNSPVITLDTAGNSYFAGIMTIGASGEIRQGTGTLGSNYTGLRIWQSSDVGLIGGYSSDTLQWYADTDGKLYAGGGGVAIDALGVHVSNNNTSEGIKMYTSDSFADDTYRASWWWTLSGAVNPINYLYAGKSTAWGDASNLWGRWNLSAGRSGTSDTVTLTVDGSTDKITADAATFDVTGNITVSGNVDGVDIAAFKSAYDNHNHDSIYLQLTGGTLIGTLTTRDIIADTTNSRNLGSSLVYYDHIYVRNLHTDTIVGTPSYAHSHDVDYVNVNGDTMTDTLTMHFDDFSMIVLNRTENDNVDNTFTIGVSYITDATTDFAFFGKSNGLQVYNDGTVKVDGNTIWHAGNDGTGTGLDADLLDGNHASAFALASHTHSYLPLSGGVMSGNIAFSGSQTVDGVDISAFKSAYDAHDHDTRYYTETEVDSLLTGYVPTTRTVSAGSGLTVTNGGALSANITISHSDTSSVANSSNSGTTAIQSMTFDTYGHVQSIATADMGTALDSRYVNVTGDTMTGGLTVPFVKNALLSHPSQASLDLSMIGYFDRNELVYANYTGSVSVAVTGAYTAINNTKSLVDGTGGFMSITGTDATTTQIVITIDRGINVSNYSRAYWQPYLAFRLNTGASYTYYNNLVVEVSYDNSTWYKPATGEWDTSDLHSEVKSAGVWSGGEARPAVPQAVWRYARFTLTDRRETSGYAAKDQVWISHVGIRHVSADFSKLWLNRAGDTMFGDLLVRNGTSNDVFFVDVSAGLTTVTGDISITDELLVGGDSTLDGELFVAPVSGNVLWVHANGIDVTGTASLVAGSAGTPALNFGTSTTGIYSPSSTSLAVTIGGSAMWRTDDTQIRPESHGGYDLGDPDYNFRSLYATNLVVQNLVAKNVIATFGGNIIVSPSNELIADAVSTDTTVDVKYNNYGIGEYVYLAKMLTSGLPAFEVIYITGSPTTITGGFRYTCQRNQDGSGANDWLTGDSMTSLRAAAGEGWIELSADNTLLGEVGPVQVFYARTDINNWDDASPVMANGNLASLVDYSSTAVFGTAAGNDLGLTPTSGFSGFTVDYTNGLRLFNTSLDIYSGGVQAVDIATTGNVKLGSNVSAAATTTFDFTASSGVLRVGPLAASKPNLYWDGTNLNLRVNTTNYAVLGASGYMRIGQTSGPYAMFDGTDFVISQAGTDVITLSSSGDSSFAGVMNIGTSGGIYQGTGSFATPTTGLKIWNDGGVGRLATYNAGVLQVYFGTSGRMNAGAGTVVLDETGVNVASGAVMLDGDGITLTAGTGEANKITWYNGSTLYFEQYGYSTGTTYRTILNARSPSVGTPSELYLYAQTSGASDNTHVVVKPGQVLVNEANFYIDTLYDLVVDGGTIYTGGGTIDLQNGDLVGVAEIVADSSTITVTGDVDLNGYDLTDVENLGIGTASPLSHGKVTIYGTASSTAGPHMDFVTSTDSYSLLQIRAWAHDNIALSFDSFWDGSSWISGDSGSNFQILKNSDAFSTRYRTVTAGSSGAWNTGTVLNASGNFGIGTTPSYKLDVNGSAHASSFPTSSDARFKENLERIENTLNKLCSLTAYNFTWKPNYSAYEQFLDDNGSPVKQLGFLAQDVEGQFPEAITRWRHTGRDGVITEDAYSVDYARMVPLIVVALSEIRRELEQLKNDR